MHETSSDRAGQLIGGKYSIERLIARGGMGLVYAARHAGTGRSVAVKLLRPELVSRPELVRRVSAEARLAVEASHPNVVEVLDAGADEAGIPYVVLERLHGQALDAFIDAPVALLPAVQALLPIVNALVSLHEAGIVHRDIKPSNIFLSRGRDGRVTPKLLDFGIAKALEATGLTLSGAALGTPAYMAPEQALGAGDAGAATDVWSLAVVFVRCLTGQLPFDAPPPRRVASLRAGLSAEDLPAVPLALGRALSRSLRFDPAERFASMAEFRDELLGALREIDPERNWPTAESVGYAAGETELSTWLQAISFDEGAPADEAGLGRRPAGIDTKTLGARETAISKSQSPQRSARLRYLSLALSVLAVSGAVALTGRHLLEGDAPTRAPSTSSAPHAEALALQPAARTASEPAAPSPPTTPEIAVSLPSAPEEPAAASASERRASEPPAPPRPSPKDARKDARSEDAERSSSEASSRRAVGANRAPIIE